ncbi:APRATAXIN-like protein [Actinidia rufa]|uniref:APRATAXIN-like protein n=1 Tax=Actinidia rufa TaxID=165716 RepID=A0A7J0EC93_9ERIC|nr:APRATAXIN-like protein [Actinidia rufa]
MDVDGGSSSMGEEEKRKMMVVILVGAPGSGKSTFCDRVMRVSTRPWVRVCQDTISNGKSGTKTQCLTSAARALKDEKSVFIDRCNLDREQRADFVKLGSPQIDVHAVVFDLPAKLCISRMLQKKELPKLSEGFSRIAFCQNESDVQAAMSTYSALGPLDTLPSGCFGQKSSDAKIQLGIMKFLKKVDAPVNAESKGNSLQNNVTTEITKENYSRCKGPEDIARTSSKEEKEVEDLALSYADGCSSLNNIPTLAFPSISTADFQFDLEKAADIIVEKVSEFVTKLGNARLVLVDLSSGSKILSLVRAKAKQKNIDSDKFLTFVGRYNSTIFERRLKAGGGGVNAAIFSAAGPALEIATKERAGSLTPGKAVVVPLPSTSPLFSREGVTHVIHVLGPNMNPQRPNFLNNDYIKGCKVLREAYSSLFEGFAFIVRSQEALCKDRTVKLGSVLSESTVDFEISCMNQVSNTDQKFKREGVYESERNKKSKGCQEELGSNIIGATGGGDNAKNEKNNGGVSKAWGSWAQALYHVAMHPEMHKNDVMEISDDIVVLSDLYPKAKRHLLVVARFEGLDRLADASKDHLELLRAMHAVGLKWAEKCLIEDKTLVFRLGYHSAPSMRQLHLHVISQDFDSKHLKNKKHWNSFNTPFFLDSVDVIEEIDKCGRAMLKDDDRLLSMELRCHRCRSAHPNLPRLKSHIGNCRAPFAPSLLQNSRLVLGQNEDGTNR